MTEEVKCREFGGQTDGALESFNQLPLWRLPLAPATNSDISCAIDCRLYPLPNGTIAVLLLTIQPQPDRVSVFQRMISLSEPGALSFFQLMSEGSAIALSFQSAEGKDEEIHSLPVHGEKLANLINGGLNHDEDLRATGSLDGAQAVRELKALFDEAFTRQQDVFAAWEEVAATIDHGKSVDDELQADSNMILIPTVHGAVLAYRIRLWSGNNSPQLIQRVADLSCAGDVEELRQFAAAGSVTVEWEYADGTKVPYTVVINGPALTTLIDHGLDFQTKLPFVSGPLALERFHELLNNALQKSDDLDRAWDEVFEAACAGVEAAANPHPQRSLFGRYSGFYLFGRTLQIISAIPFGSNVLAFLPPLLPALLLMALGWAQNFNEVTDANLAAFVYCLGIGIWNLYLDSAGIVRINMPLFPVPIWAFGFLFAVCSLFGMIFG